MKKFIKKILMAIASFAVAFTFLATPITVSAEETSQPPEIETGSSEVETDDGAGKDGADEETTFEDFLTWAQKEAEKYGYGDEYTAAMEAIKAAATQKQVTLSTIASAALAITVLVLLVYYKCKDKKFKDAIIAINDKLDGKLDTQRDGLNSLIDGENALLEGKNQMLDCETKNGQKTEELKTEVQAIKKGFSAFISAFLRFTDGVKLGDNKKTEVQTNCLNALKEIDGEVRADEDNKK